MNTNPAIVIKSKGSATTFKQEADKLQGAPVETRAIQEQKQQI